MSAKDRINLLNEDAKVLEGIANQFGESSREYTALRHAAIALSYALIEGHDKFNEYFRNFDEGELTPEQRKHLIEMGIDPDGK